MKKVTEIIHILRNFFFLQISTIDPSNRIFAPKPSQYLQLLLHRLVAAAGNNDVLLVERRREDAAKGVVLDADEVVEIDDAILTDLSQRWRQGENRLRRGLLLQLMNLTVSQPQMP